MILRDPIIGNEDARLLIKVNNVTWIIKKGT